jgi:hypothetical protein
MKVSSSGNFIPAPPGNHIARCIGLIDLGTQPVTFQGQVKHQRKVRVTWELPEELMEDKRPFTIGKKYTLSIGRNARLRQDLESWRGKAFTKEEEAGFELKTILDKVCQLNCVASDDGQYTNINGITPLPKKTKAPERVNELVFFSLDPQEFDAKAFSALGQKTQEMIVASPEYAALKKGDGEAHDDDDDLGQQSDDNGEQF